MVSENVKDRVKKLLSLSKSDNQHEAEIALKRAHDLMSQWAIDEISINKEISSEQLFGKIARHIYNNVPKRNVLLYQAAGKLHNCHIIEARSGHSLRRLYVFGTESDLSVFSETVKYIADVLDRLVKEEKHKRKHEKPGHEKPGKGYYHSFHMGILHGIYAKVSEMKSKQTREQSNTEYGLILVDNEKKIEKRIKSDFPRLHTTKHYCGRNHSAYGSGREKGSSVNFDPQVRNGNRRQLNG